MNHLPALPVVNRSRNHAVTREIGLKSVELLHLKTSREVAPSDIAHSAELDEARRVVLR